MNKKNIAYISGSRAEYGIVKRLLKRLQDDKNINFHLIVTAMHLSEFYGNTYKFIEEDGLKIDFKIPINLDNQNNENIINSMSECLKLFGHHFQENQYDALIILGDRFEIFAVAIAAAMHNIPIIHLHGGEQTVANYDEFIRHSITKMAKLHLTSTEEYRKRVIQLGEHPENVINIGSLGAENSLKLNLLTEEALQQKFSVLKKKYFVIAFHPETLGKQDISQQINELISALEQFKTDFSFIFIGANADTNSNLIYEKIRLFCAQNSNSHLYSNVSPEEYLSLIKYSAALIGNSSSGIIEAPSLKTATINIGNRQQGRIAAASVINCECEVGKIKNAIEKALAQDFQEKLISIKNPYFQENSLELAYTAIKDFLNSENIQQYKIFYDL